MATVAVNDRTCGRDEHKPTLNNKLFHPMKQGNIGNGARKKITRQYIICFLYFAVQH